MFYCMGKEIIKTRLEAVFHHTIGSEFGYFCRILDMSGSILLGSSAIDILLFGSSSAHSLDLHIAAPLHVGEPLVAFLVAIGFSTLDVRAVGMPPNVLNLYHHHFLRRQNCVITVICSDSTSVLPIVLTHKTSFDCVFLTTSGLFITYPELVDQHMAYGPPTDPSAHLNHAFINRGYQLCIINTGWNQPCKQSCPTIWRCNKDGRMIVWGDGVMPSSIIDGHKFMWRLGPRCWNANCPSYNFLNLDLFMGPCSRNDVCHVAKEVAERNSTRPNILGMLFAHRTNQPFTVPVYIDKGKTILSVDDLSF
ncbi:hypothetical protein F4604DRAFT_1924206 [Suillus subluteus]|nr:hypothetical protein F4604DRAFT_1924206 [Suillus subluteus]